MEKTQMKKTLKIIFFNIIFALILILALDEISNCIQYYHPAYLGLGGYSTDRIENALDYDKNKKSVIFVGCSFTYGQAIYATENISYKIQELTHRKTYNKGNSDWGPQFVLRDIQNSSLFNGDEIVEPEYVVYTLTSDHLRRIYIDYFSRLNDIIYDLYRIENNKLIFNEPKVRFVNYIKMTNAVKNLNFLRYRLLPDDKKFDRLKLYLLTINDEIKKRYPDAKFVVIVYNPEADAASHNIKPFRTERWGELEKEGIIVIRFDTPEYNFLNGDEYVSQIDYVHPSAKVWEVLAPVISDKLGL